MAFHQCCWLVNKPWSCPCEKLAAAAGLRRGRGFREPRALLRSCGSSLIGLQTFGHFVADDVHEVLKGLLDVNVVLGTCFKKLKPYKRHRKHSLIILLSADSEGTGLWFEW